jgi:hypothetical protein
VVPPADPGPPAANLNPDEITLDDEEQDVVPAPVAPPPREKTNFLALDKCIPNTRRQFLEVNPGFRLAKFSVLTGTSGYGHQRSRDQFASETHV